MSHPTAATGDHTPQSTDGGQAPADTARPRRHAWLTVALCLLIFVAGGVVGVGATLTRIGRQAREALEHPESVPARVAARLQSKLDLTDEQTGHVEDIVRQRHAKLLAAREDLLQNSVDPELDGLERDIEAVIGPEKSRKFRERLNGFRDEWIRLRPHLPAPRRER